MHPAYTIYTMEKQEITWKKKEVKDIQRKGDYKDHFMCARVTILFIVLAPQLHAYYYKYCTSNNNNFIDFGF